MEIHKDVLVKNFPTLPRSEPILVDHTALIAAKTCPKKYFYQIVLGRSSRQTAPYFSFGAAYHKFRELLEIDWAAKAFGVNPEMYIPGAIERTVLYYQSRLDKEPKTSSNTWDKWDYLNKDRLVKCCLVAANHWIDEKKKGAIEVISVEQHFNVQLSDGSFKSGRADQIVKWSGQIWGRDFKTTSKDTQFYEKGLDPNDQFTGYTLGESKLTGSRIAGQLVEVLVNIKSKTPYIKIFPVQYTSRQLAEYENDCVFWNEIISLWRQRDHYPRAEHNCGFCAFHPVCSKSSEQSQLAALENLFVFKPWDAERVHLDDNG